MIKCCKKIELRVNEMNAEKINNYYAELEKIATYNNESITDEEFSKNLLEIKMDSMNSYERHLVHDVLSNYRGVKTESEGEEPNRCVVIKPSK